MTRLRTGLIFVLLLMILAITAILVSAELTVGVLGASKAADLVTTARASGRCRETNPLFGPAPSNGRITFVGAGYFAGEVVVAYVLRRAFRGHRFLGQLWRIEPIFQIQAHIQYTGRNIVIGCS